MRSAHRAAGDSRRWVAIEPTNRVFHRQEARLRSVLLLNLRAASLCGTVAMPAPSQRTTAEPQRKMRWNGRKRFLRLGPERYRRTQRPIIGGKPLERGGSRKGRQPRLWGRGYLMTLLTMMSLPPRPIALERKQRSR